MANRARSLGVRPARVQQLTPRGPPLRSPLLRSLLVAVITTFGVHVVANAWGRHDPDVWTWAFQRLATTPAPLGIVAAALAFVTFVVSQFSDIRPLQAFAGALLPYPVFLAADVAAHGARGDLVADIVSVAPYLLVPAAAALGAWVPVPGQVAEVDGRPLTRAGNTADVHAALEDALDEGGNVIVTQFRADRFVQFQAEPPATLVLDLPRASLDDAAWGRARALLEPLGALVDREVLRLDVGGDPAAGAELALRVFEEVHGVTPPLELRIETL